MDNIERPCNYGDVMNNGGFFYRGKLVTKHLAQALAIFQVKTYQARLQLN